MLLRPECAKLHDSRTTYAELVLLVEKNIVVDHGTVPGK